MACERHSTPSAAANRGRGRGSSNWTFDSWTSKMLLSVGLVASSAVLLAIAVAASLCKYLTWHFGHWGGRGVAGPRPVIWRGTFPRSAAGECSLVEELDDIYRAYKTRHKFVGIFTARQPKLFVLDPQLAQHILTGHFRQFRDNESSQWTTSAVEQLRVCSPFVCTGERWKTQRAELTPALAAPRIKQFHGELAACASQLVASIKDNLGVPVDAKAMANRFTAAFMASFIWGFAVAGDNGAAAAADVHRMADSMIAQAQRCVRYYGGRSALWPWLRRLHPMRFFPAASDRFFLALAREGITSASGKRQRTSPVIDHLVRLAHKRLGSPPLTVDQIAGHTTTVLIDGFETAAVLIAHCLLLLARNPHVQRKLRDELRGLDSSVSPLVDSDRLEKAPFLGQCLQETMRLFPPLATLFKLCTEPVTLTDRDGTEVTLRVGDPVYISTYSFHRDGDYFPDPEQFQPERFDPQVGGDARRFTQAGVFLPFGDGPRVCPGMKLGLAEAKAAVAAVVSNFEVHVDAATTRADNAIAADAFLLALDGGIQLIFRDLRTGLSTAGYS